MQMLNTVHSKRKHILWPWRLKCNSLEKDLSKFKYVFRAVARALIGGGGCIFIYSGSARLASFEMNFISKEVSRREPEDMNIHPPISVLATALYVLRNVLKV